MSDVSQLANIDWPTVAAAGGTLIATVWLSIQGVKKGREKVEKGQSSITSIVGASLIENATITALTQQLQHNSEVSERQTRAIETQTEVLRTLCASITRQIDLDLMQTRKLDYRDNRDNPG